MTDAPIHKPDPTLAPVEKPGPGDRVDTLVAAEAKRAFVWCGIIAIFIASWYLSQPLLVLFGGVVVAAMFDGGTRLLGRVLPIGRAVRLTIVMISVAMFFVWIFMLAGSQLAAQFQNLRAVVMRQFYEAQTWASTHGLVMGSTDLHSVGTQLFGSIGRVTSAISTVAASLTDGAMIIILGAFLAIEPGVYMRGIGWLVPLDKRDRFYAALADMAFTLRRLMAGRLLGMAVEGITTGILLTIGGIPMAALLGVLTGVLAFLPNIGAIISGSLIILVGFSMGLHSGIYAVGVYMVVQIIDGYVIVPYVARKSVDLPPALVLAAQIMLGAAFGFLGMMFADSLLAMVKVALIHLAGGETEKPHHRAKKPGHWWHRHPMERVVVEGKVVGAGVVEGSVVEAAVVDVDATDAQGGSGTTR